MFFGICMHSVLRLVDKCIRNNFVKHCVMQQCRAFRKCNTVFNKKLEYMTGICSAVFHLCGLSCHEKESLVVKVWMQFRETGCLISFVVSGSERYKRVKLSVQGECSKFIFLCEYIGDIELTVCSYNNVASIYG